METQELIINIIGWIGALSLLCGYLLVLLNITHGKSVLYQLLNVIGSIGFIINSYYFGAMPSVGLNLIWLLIGTITIGKTFKNSRKQENENI
ncbi:MAG: hypothetical protein HOI58_00095 [Kordiimonadaceae bacterium]|jgi:hypothetical protein|nr:hypothetical protein [Kordiimonadaceae bacterium]